MVIDAIAFPYRLDTEQHDAGYCITTCGYIGKAGIVWLTTNLLNVDPYNKNSLPWPLEMHGLKLKHCL